jgi:prepilin-type N-terminal cleavage/methylation domain-containing protein/prepilin-type processing-associated H-X9-DG protein
MMRKGMTLVECLVAIAIIGVVMALGVSAIQRVRDVAARAGCSNNLRQIGLAAHGYHGTMGKFPPGVVANAPQDDYPYPFMSWLTPLLTYLEQDPIWMQAQEDYARAPNPFRARPPHAGLSTVVTIFGCPADWRVHEVQNPKSDPNVFVALTSYLGVEGLDLYSHDGVLFADSAVRFSDITDGTSATVFAGERPPSLDLQFGWWYAGAGQSGTGSADMVLGVEELNVSEGVQTSCPNGVYKFGPGDLTNKCDVFHFWSLHRGGANFLFADGSVRFLDYSAAPFMPALASRAGGEASSLP